MLFRSWTPTTEPTRYLPRLEDVIDGSLAKGETYATTSRDLNFRLTVRDGNGGVSSDDVNITVDGNSGPFKLIQPSRGAAVAGNSTVEWDVAGTAQAPISCSQVDVMLSTDGGVNFDQTLLTATSNDGSELASFPAMSINNARLMVKCSDNIFFAISDAFNLAVPDEVRAADDAYTLDEDSAATSLNVLANDSGEGELTITGVNYTGLGTVTFTASAINYQPEAGFVGSETITYTIVDSADQSASGTVTVTVNSSDVTVSAVNDSYELNQGSAPTVLDILANDVGQGTLTISAVNYSGSGTLTNSDTKVDYQPAEDFSGVDSFTYTITDEASQTATAMVTINVAASTSGGGSSSSGGGSLNFISLLMLAALWLRRIK